MTVINKLRIPPGLSRVPPPEEKPPPPPPEDPEERTLDLETRIAMLLQNKDAIATPFLSLTEGIDVNVSAYFMVIVWYAVVG